MRCPYCNSKLKRNTNFCPECGMAILFEDSFQSNRVKSNRGVYILTIFAIILLACLVVLFIFGKANHFPGSEIVTTSETTQESSLPSIAFSDDPTAISEASQSVVKLNCYDKSGELYATGSGFACFADNVIVTNYHVIEGGVYSIHIKTESGYTYIADTILAVDENKDLAILQTNKSHDLEPLQLNELTEIEKGESVVAIGSPLGLLNTVSTGVFSGQFNKNGISILQFTAPISSGSSGGALFNKDGDVVGVTFASYVDGQNLNLAIPAKYVSKLYKDRGKPYSVSDWFETNDGGYSYVSNSEIVDYQDLISEPDRYNKTIVTLNGYVANASENNLYMLPSQEYITWEDEPSSHFFTDEFVGYMYYHGMYCFEDTKMISCNDHSRSIQCSTYLDKTITITGWFEYTNSSATIKLLHISE